MLVTVAKRSFAIQLPASSLRPSGTSYFPLLTSYLRSEAERLFKVQCRNPFGILSNVQSSRLDKESFAEQSYQQALTTVTITSHCGAKRSFAPYYLYNNILLFLFIKITISTQNELKYKVKKRNKKIGKKFKISVKIPDLKNWSNLRVSFFICFLY